MNMKRILLLLALSLIVPASVFAVAGKLDTLTFGFPDDTPTETQKKVHAYLTHGITWIEGHFMNTAITQTFSGSAGQLNELIQMLQTNRFELTVEFADLKDNRVAFSRFQNMAGPARIRITIDTTKNGFKLSELKIQIPPAKGNVEPAAPPKQSRPNKP
jgi:hypothetical protein